MKQLLNLFFKLYNRHYILNLSIALGLFLLQLIHLYWLTTDVVLKNLTNLEFPQFTNFFYLLILIVDYTEIPALLATSLIYLNELRKKITFKNILFLILLNSQWLHLFWITDEFVIEHLTQTAHLTILPLWLAWLAIVIDYLELPVIFDTLLKLFYAIKEKKLRKLPQALEKR